MKIGNLDSVMEAIDTRDWLGHVIVCGLQGLGVRIVELLQSAGIRVVVVGNAGEDHHLRLVQALDVPRIDGSPRNPDSLWAAGLAGALAVVCAEDDDLRCLEAALLVQELAPRTRVIVRQSNPAVGRAVTSAITKGHMDAVMRSIFSPVIELRTNRLAPTGGVIRPMFSASTIMIPAWTGFMPIDVASAPRIGPRIINTALMSMNIPRTKSSRRIIWRIIDGSEVRPRNRWVIICGSFMKVIHQLRMEAAAMIRKTTPVMRAVRTSISTMS
mgnify:CR=1 FL=1